MNKTIVLSRYYTRLPSRIETISQVDFWWYLVFPSQVLLFMTGYVMGHLMKMDGGEQWEFSNPLLYHNCDHRFAEYFATAVLICCVAWI
ncbi:MAG: hypothetical protein IPN72_19895 [Saprospiraceae bacterium]|nr:hypothetical protein [Saprospiraceae bacterium]